MKKIFSMYFAKLILVFLVIGLLAIAIQAVFSYVKSTQIVREKVHQSSSLLLKQSQQNIEQRLQMIESVVLQFSSSKTVLQSMDTELTSEQFQFVNELSQSMSGVQVLQYGVQEIYLINLSLDWVLTGGVRKLEAAAEQNIRERLLPREKSSFWFLDDMSLLPEMLNRQGIKHSLVLVQKVPLWSGSPQGLILAELYVNAFNDLLSAGIEQGTVLVLNRDGKVIAHSPGEKFGAFQDVRNRIPYDRIRNDGSGFFESTVFGQKVLVNYSRSTYNDWTYISLVPLDKIQRETRKVGSQALLISLATFLITGICSYVGAKYMYVPVRRVLQALKAAGHADEKRGNEFDVMMERIGFILHRQRELDEKAKHHFKELKENFLRRLMGGEITGPEVRHGLALYQFPEKRKYVIIAIQIDEFEKTHYEEKNRDLLMFAIQNIADELLPLDMSCGSVLVNHYFAAVCGFDQTQAEQIKKQIYASAERLQEKVYHFLHLEISVGVSRSYDTLMESHKAYIEAEEALKYRIHFGKTAILYMQELQPKEKQLLRYPVHLLHLLSESIKVGDAVKSKERVRQMIEEMTKGHCSAQEYEFALKRLVLDVLKIPADLDIDIHRLLHIESGLIQKLVEKSSMEEVAACLDSELIEPVAELICSSRNSESIRIIEEVQRMIRLEFEQDLTLESAAERLNVHPSYIRRLMKQELGASFSDCLMEYRMASAKLWLAETEMRVSEIAERLRYSNSQNFIRYFRRTVGLTPGQYREAALAAKWQAESE